MVKNGTPVASWSGMRGGRRGLGEGVRREVPRDPELGADGGEAGAQLRVDADPARGHSGRTAACTSGSVRGAIWRDIAM